ncbi:MAG TPA: alkaline phosphatase family protein [Gaiellaceae bacterium]|nr:alkaline phosphatase family protein [Gaiellaceae bacterium]
MAKVMLIGLDCAEPSLVLERWRDELPTLSGLMERGRFGRLRSVVPPITVPAWSCMMASRTPGDLGVYGFRNRVDHSYDNLVISDGGEIETPRLWDLATRYGKPSIVIGVPGTYPPRPLNGVLVSGFMTPSLQSTYTYPPLLAREIEGVVGEYLFDCTDFRTDDKDGLLRQVYEMTDKRFRLAEHLLETRPWELFAMVEIGLDRMHHAFWADLDERHHRHDPAGRYGSAIFDYVRHLDELIARLLSHADDDTAVLVVSDHGAKRMEGGIRINEWLRREGFLRTRSRPNGVTSLAGAGVDWSATTAWGEGGYYGRVFLNVEGREPQGAVPRADFERVRGELAERLASIPGPEGERLKNRVHTPEELYDEVNGVPPDLLVFFGDLSWRAVGTVGGEESIYTFENDTGPDGANHAQEGLLIMSGHGVEPGRAGTMDLLDVAPTVLELLGLEPSASMRGRSLLA